MRFGRAIGCGSVIGAAIYYGLIFVARPIGNTELGELVIGPLAYVPDLMCEWLAQLFFGRGGDIGMFFIFPTWILFGAVVGAIVGATMAALSKNRRTRAKTTTEPGDGG